MHKAHLITFQLASDYLPKIALRIESLYDSIYQSCKETHAIIHQYALNNLIELIRLVEKPELKSRFLKEIVRIEHQYKSNSIKNQPLLDDIHQQIHFLNQVIGRFGENIYSIAFLQSIRAALPAYETLAEPLPQVVMWLATDAALRQRDLVLWLDNFRTLQKTVNFYLSLIRAQGNFQELNNLNGFYQQSLPRNLWKIILLRIDKNSSVIPKMQVGHHGLSIRFYDSHTMEKAAKTDVFIELAVCCI